MTIVKSHKTNTPEGKTRMTDTVELYFDKKGLPRAKGKSSQKSLASFLECDIQNDTDLLEEFIKNAKQVSERKIERFEINGKAHKVIITPEIIIIDPLIDPGNIPSQINHTQFETILSRWLEFLTQTPKISV